jgi:hypothetical protein
MIISSTEIILSSLSREVYLFLYHNLSSPLFLPQSFPLQSSWLPLNETKKAKNADY